MIKTANTIAIGFLSAVILSGCATSTTSTPYQPAKPTMAQAQQAFAQHHFVEAQQALTILAIDGNAKAQYALGYLYFYGQGTARDLDLARGWFKKAAAQGYAKARTALEMMAAQTLTRAN